MASSHLEDQFELLCRLFSWPEYQREYRFHPTRKWRFDFAWPDHKVAVEIEGGVWSHGRHNRATGFIEDCDKYNEATILGWRVLRFTHKQLADTDKVCSAMERLLNLG